MYFCLSIYLSAKLASVHYNSSAEKAQVRTSVLHGKSAQFSKLRRQRNSQIHTNYIKIHKFSKTAIASLTTSSVVPVSSAQSSSFLPTWKQLTTDKLQLTNRYKNLHSNANHRGYKFRGKRLPIILKIMYPMIFLRNF